MFAGNHVGILVSRHWRGSNIVFYFWNTKTRIFCRRFPLGKLVLLSIITKHNYCSVLGSAVAYMLAVKLDPAYTCHAHIQMDVIRLTHANRRLYCIFMAHSSITKSRNLNCSIDMHVPSVLRNKLRIPYIQGLGLSAFESVCGYSLLNLIVWSDSCPAWWWPVILHGVFVCVSTHLLTLILSQ